MSRFAPTPEQLQVARLFVSNPARHLPHMAPIEAAELLTCAWQTIRLSRPPADSLPPTTRIVTVPRCLFEAGRNPRRALHRLTLVGGAAGPQGAA